jgi:chloramphenicol O-acetyltransferase type A
VSGWVDLTKWKRRPHYLLFRSYAHPFFSVSVDVDVTAVWNYCRRPGAPSFFLTSLFFMLNAANDVEAFRLRLRKRGVRRHDRVGVGPTVLRPDDTFGFARIEAAPTLDRFAEQGRAAIETAIGGETLNPDKSDDVVFHSVLPWLRFTAYTNALPGGDSIPRIVFGKCTADGARMSMPVAVEVHHALVDGLDVARFLERFSEGLETGLRPGPSARKRDE